MTIWVQKLIPWSWDELNQFGHSLWDISSKGTLKVFLKIVMGEEHFHRILIEHGPLIPWRLLRRLGLKERKRVLFMSKPYWDKEWSTRSGTNEKTVHSRRRFGSMVEPFRKWKLNPEWDVFSWSRKWHETGNELHYVWRRCLRNYFLNPLNIKSLLKIEIFFRWSMTMAMSDSCNEWKETLRFTF